MRSNAWMSRGMWIGAGLAVTGGIASARASGSILHGMAGSSTSTTNAPLASGECEVFDDGVTENCIGCGAMGPQEDVLWMHREGTPTGSTTVISISTAWGSLMLPGSVPDGSPARVGIWDDPNDDGIPNDLVLLQEVHTVTVGGDTDVLQVVPIAPQPTTGIYFIGASVASGLFPGPMDESSTSSGRAWICGDCNGSIDYSNLNGEPQPPEEMDRRGDPAVFLLRADCITPTMTGFCYPNAGGTRSCPCGNQPVPDDGTRGCNNYGPNPVGGTGGAILTATGDAVASPSNTLVLHVTEMQTPATIVVLFAGSSTLSPGVQSGAGVRCIGGLQIRRPYQSISGFNARSIDFPSGNANPNQDLWERSNSPAAGTTKYYYAAYRNPQSGGFPPCTPATAFNLTNAGAVLWHL